ncbi:hypothetical protein DKX38_006312 [Salix brachista]|uniref:Integrase catalytic domain-containing protein n=1 Tax=Salix brachista TaxID=2182728 RepID=A0A5N5N1I1_9ROSI|nr:hypothetical protein DKX38_006312 [Salix brachista]
MMVVIPVEMSLWGERRLWLLTLDDDESNENGMVGHFKGIVLPKPEGKFSTDVMSLGGALYFVSFIDHHSRKIWATCLKSKDQVLDVFKDFHARVERETGRKLKCVRADNGGEYRGPFEKYCREHVAMINLSPSVPLEFDVPNIVWKGKDVSYAHLRVFGCRAFVHVPRDERSKLDSKTKQCIFLGSEDDEFGYRLWDPKENKILPLMLANHGGDLQNDDNGGFLIEPLVSDSESTNDDIDVIPEQDIQEAPDEPQLRRSTRPHQPSTKYSPHKKSTSGYLMKFAGGAVSWQSRLQKCVALSTTEAEYIALTEGGKELLWMKKFLHELGLVQENFVLYYDSQSAIYLNAMEMKSFVVEKIHTDNNASDMMTKPLPREKFEFCRKEISDNVGRRIQEGEVSLTSEPNSKKDKGVYVGVEEDEFDTEIKDDGLGGMGFPLPDLDVVENSNLEADEDYCDHSFVLKDDIGYVCLIFGVIKRAIAIKIEIQFNKVKRNSRTYISESKDRDSNGMVGFDLFEEDLMVTNIPAHSRHMKQMEPHQVEGFNFLRSNLVADNPRGVHLGSCSWIRYGKLRIFRCMIFTLLKMIVTSIGDLEIVGGAGEYSFPRNPLPKSCQGGVNVLNLVRLKFLRMDTSRASVKRILSKVNIPGARKQFKVGATFYDLVEQTIQKDQDFKRPKHEVQKLKKLAMKLKRSSVGSVVYLHPKLNSSENYAITDDMMDNLLETVHVREGVKAKFFLNILSLCMSAGEKLLVFSQYITSLKFFESLVLKEKDWILGKEIFAICSESSSDHQEWSMEHFNNSTDVKVLFGSIKACAEGISPMGASRKIILDVHLNPSVTGQAIGRAFRPEQAKKVYAYRLVTADSPEEEDHNTCFRKEAVAKMWSEWNEYYGYQDFKVETVELDDNGDRFSESPQDLTVIGLKL